MNTSRTVLATLTALGALGGALLSVSAGASTQPTTKVYDCSRPLAHPREIVLTCADANRSLTSISWTHWGAPSAQGRAILEWNTCTPSCAAGHLERRAVSFSATGLITRGGQRLYTRLVGPTWAWQNGTTHFSLPTKAL